MQTGVLFSHAACGQCNIWFIPTTSGWGLTLYLIFQSFAPVLTNKNPNFEIFF
jgi:hypothetical protein